MNLPDLYRRVFDTSQDGKDALVDLMARFHDCPLYATGGIEGERETARRVARREVVSYILNRLGQVPDDGQHSDDD